MEQERIKIYKREFKGRKFALKEWQPPKENHNWSHDHCEICNTEISNKAEKEGYTDKKRFYWICKSCYTKYKRLLSI